MMLKGKRQPILCFKNAVIEGKAFIKHAWLNLYT